MSLSDLAAASVDRHKVWLQSKLSVYPPEWFNNRDRLADWAFAHASPTGDVWMWMTAPAYAGVGWQLWAPGTRHLPDGSVDRKPVLGPNIYYGDDEQVWLADVEYWMRPWVEEMSGRRVVEMVEGLYWYGGIDYKYVIYARVMS